MFNDPKQVLQAWLDGVNAGNLNEVLALYSENAVLLPTFSDKNLITPDGIRAYFEKLGGYNSLDVQVRDETLLVQELSNSIFSLGGVYGWHFEVEGKSLDFEARFTYTVDINLSRPIVHHHSSQVPQPL